jgi:hypothetical protein
VSFLSNGIWWALLAGASLLFWKYCRLGVDEPRSPIRNLSQLAFLALVVLAFWFTGWRGGLGVCVGVALVALLLPRAIKSLVSRQAPVVPTEVVPRAIGRVGIETNRQTPSLGQLADLRSMILSGLGRAKVWRLIQQGRLVAYEDPKDGRVTLVRREDADALHQAGSEEQSGDRS